MEPPEISACIDDIVVDIPVDVLGQKVNFSQPNATDNSGEAYLTHQSHFSGDIFTVGITKVTFIFEDFSGNQGNCSFNVIVRDSKYCNNHDKTKNEENYSVFSDFVARLD